MAITTTYSLRDDGTQDAGSYANDANAAVLSGGQVVINNTGLVAALANGNAVKVFENYASPDTFVVETPDGAEVASGSFGSQSVHPLNVIGLKGPASGFVIVDVAYAAASDGDIEARLYAADGTAGPVVTVATGAANDGSPSVAALADGAFAVAWTRTSGSTSAIWTAVYEANGDVRTGPTLLDDTGAYNGRPDVTALSNGGFAVAYTDNEYAGTADITIATLNAAGNAQTKLRANVDPALTQESSVVEVRPGVLALDSEGSSGHSLRLIDTSTGFISTPITSQYSFPSYFGDSDLATSPGKPLVLATLDYYDTGREIYESLYYTNYGVVRTQTGDADDNTIVGDDFDDILIGAGGNDTLIGGAGMDTASYENAAAVTVDLAITGQQDTVGDGLDTLTGIENLTGSAFADHLYGDGNANILIGGDGDDVLDGRGGADILIGGSGNDTFYVDSNDDIVDGGLGDSDTIYASVDYTLPFASLSAPAEILAAAPGAGPLTLTTLNANVRVIGGDADDTLIALADKVTLVGGLGDDVLKGFASTFGVGTTVDYSSAASKIVVDLTVTTAQATGGAGSDQLTGIRNLIGSDYNDRLTGSDLANRLVGGAGNDTLSGGNGNDTLEGGVGDDLLVGGDGIDTATYANAAAAVTVDLSVTVAQNTGSAGTDRLLSVENLIGSAFADQLTGNGAANNLVGGKGNDTLVGNAGNDTLDGGDDDDTLDGGSGIDTLNGGLGNDSLTGGTGDDTLDGGLGDDTLDGGGQIDTASYDSATAGVTVSLLLSGPQNTGGSGSDTLIGIENLTGSAYGDVLTGDDGRNIIRAGLQDSYGGGDDMLFGGGGDDLLIADYNNDWLDGGTGADTMMSDYGRTTFVVDDLGDIVIDTFAYDIDTVRSSVTFTMPVNIERLFLTGRADIDGTGNAADNRITGNIRNNVISGGLGDDILDGGKGIDTASYAGASSGVTVDLSKTGEQNTGAAGHDTLVNFENVLGSGFNDKLTGNALANQLMGGDGDDTLTGNDGNDTLDGGLGNDTLTGGAGDDSYIVDSVGDIVREYAAGNVDPGGIDTIVSSISFDLSTTNGRYVENLTLAGSDPLNGVGNALANLMFGNGAANKLEGLGGDDTLNGGDGADTLLGGDGKDTLTGGKGADMMDGGADDDIYYADVTDTVIDSGTSTGDRVISVGSFTLKTGSGIEQLEIRPGNFNGNLTGNELSNRISGGDGINVLKGLAGDDTLIAGGGNDTLEGGVGRDSLSGGLGLDTFVFKTGDTGLTGTTIDIVTDFVSGTDRIDLAIASGSLAAGAYAETSIASNAFGTALNAANAQMSADAGVKAVFVAGSSFGWLFWDTGVDHIPDEAIRLNGVNNLNLFGNGDLV